MPAALLAFLFTIFGLTAASAADPSAQRRDVPYVDGAHAKQTLDVYLPEPREDAEDGVPCVIYVHGGAWAMGDKSRTLRKEGFYTAQGVAFISVNYRLSPEVQHPAHAEDVAAAIAWVFERAPSLGIDPERIALMGHSAGAHLVSLVATEGSLLAAHDLKPSMLAGVVSLDTASHQIHASSDRPRLQTMITNAFGTDPAVWKQASPLYHASEGGSFPPFMLVYAAERADALRTNRAMHEALIKAGGVSQLVRAKHKDHAAVNRDVIRPNDPMAEAIDVFLNQVFSGED